MPKRAKWGSGGGRAKKKAKKDDPLAELKALKALVTARWSCTLRPASTGARWGLYQLLSRVDL